MPARGLFVNLVEVGENELTQDVCTRTVCIHAMHKSHREGRQEAEARASQRAHARRLLFTLISVCRRLRGLQTDPDARVAYAEVESELVKLRTARRLAGISKPRARKRDR